jgi:hypothetical protein
MLEMDRLVIENPDLAEILLQASTEPERLTPADRSLPGKRQVCS